MRFTLFVDGSMRSSIGDLARVEAYARRYADSRVEIWHSADPDAHDRLIADDEHQTRAADPGPGNTRIR